jgi:predicted dehydrogenase
VPGVRLVAVSRRNRELGQDLAGKFGARYYEDYRHLLDDPEVDAVVIVSPSGCHLEMAVEAARRSKAILLEKPIGVTAAEGDDILEAVEAHNARMMVAQTLRYEPLAVGFRDALPQIGRVRALNILHCSQDIRLAPGASEEPSDCRGVVLDTGVHYFDLLGWLFPDRLDRVRCETRRYDRSASEDAFSAQFSGPDLLATVDVCRATPARHETWVAAGPHGILEGERFGAELRLVTPEGTSPLPLPAAGPTLPKVLNSFVHSLVAEEPFEVTGESARAAVAIAEACMKSATDGQSVRLE